MHVPYKTTRRIEFRDTDTAGIAHFSVFFTLMEQVEHEFLRSLGLSVMMSDADGPFGFPRVSAQCDFRSPVKFEDLVDVELRLERIGSKSVTFGFRFSAAGRLVAEGRLTTVCCRVRPGAEPEGLPIPAWFRSKLEAAAAPPGNAP